VAGADTACVTQNPPVTPTLNVHITHNMGESSYAQHGLLKPKHRHQTITEIKETQQPLPKLEYGVQHRHAHEKSRGGDPPSVLSSLHQRIVLASLILTCCPGFSWDRVNFLPSSCCVLYLV